MKNTIQQHKPFFLFLFKFIAFYLVFTFMYKSYLNTFDSQHNQVDGITKFVAYQTENCLNLFGKNALVTPHEKEASFKIIYHNSYLARIVEGCNAISVIILFASFVFAFSARFKATLWFILLGSVLIFVLNICRIALLTVGLFYFPESESVLHNIVFPVVIYGVVFVLWIVWVLKFSKYANGLKK